MPEGKNIEALGSSLFDVEAILSQPDCSLFDILPKGGKIHVRLEVCNATNNATPPPCSFRFQLRALELPNTRRNFMDRPNFYFEIQRKQKGMSQDIWHPIYRTKQTTLTLNPFWEMDELDLEVLCNNDLHRELRLMILDLDGTNRKQMGWVDTTPEGLLGHKAKLGNADDSNAYIITKGMDSQYYTSAKIGKLIVLEAQVQSRGRAVADALCAVIPTAIAVEIMPAPRRNETFEDIQERCNIDITFAIDFTKNNGQYTTPGTSHFRGTGLNNYQWVATTLGATIGKYSKTGEIHVYGFGGQYHGRDYDIFQCGSQAKVNDVNGLLDAYNNVFSTGITFGNRCKYDSVIMAAANQAQKQLDLALQHAKLAYHVLFVLTTGSEMDVLAAKEKLAAASKCPLSIVFIRIENSQRGTFGDIKIRTYLQTQQCRSSCHCIDSVLYTNTHDSHQLSEACLNKIKIDVLHFFTSRGLI